MIWGEPLGAALPNSVVDQTVGALTPSDGPPPHRFRTGMIGTGRWND